MSPLTDTIVRLTGRARFTLVAPSVSSETDGQGVLLKRACAACGRTWGATSLAAVRHPCCPYCGRPEGA